VQQEKHDKLIQLIGSSSILSPREKAEWTQLLELMNDKQTNELEKILLVAAEQDDGAAPVQPRPALVTPESLIHNLQTNQPVPAVVRPPRPLEDIKRNQPFTRIKDILAEKELPQGHPGPLEELELSGPKVEAKPLPEPARPAPPLARPPLPVPPAKPKTASEPAVNLSSLLAKKLSNQDGLSARFQPKGPVLPKVPIKSQVSQQVDREGRNAGVSLDKVRGFDQAEKVFQPVQKQTFRSEHFYEKPSISSLQSLTQLTYANFSAAKAIELYEPLRQFIKQYGYYDTRSFLEQSPLYQTYVDTGVKVLGGQADFVQEWEGLMSQEDFEKFADLLIQMHTV